MGSLPAPASGAQTRSPKSLKQRRALASGGKHEFRNRLEDHCGGHGSARPVGSGSGLCPQVGHELRGADRFGARTRSAGIRGCGDGSRSSADGIAGRRAGGAGQAGGGFAASGDTQPL